MICIMTRVVSDSLGHLQSATHFRFYKLARIMKFHLQSRSGTVTFQIVFVVFLSDLCIVPGEDGNPPVCFSGPVCPSVMHVCVVVWVVSASQSHTSSKEAGRNMLQLVDQWEVGAGGGGPFRKPLAKYQGFRPLTDFLTSMTDCSIFLSIFNFFSHSQPLSSPILTSFLSIIYTLALFPLSILSSEHPTVHPSSVAPHVWKVWW